LVEGDVAPEVDLDHSGERGLSPSAVIDKVDVEPLLERGLAFAPNFAATLS
jgi:hypothetical protein